MTTQTSRPFACRQCQFCKEAFRMDGGATGMESYELGGWFCSHGCYNMARLFEGSDNGTFNQGMKHNLINTYQNCYTKTVYNEENMCNEEIPIPKINAMRTRDSIERGDIYIVKSEAERHQYDDDSSQPKNNTIGYV